MSDLPVTPFSLPAPHPAQSSLLEAFSGFRHAATTLEHSYRELTGEVTRLRRELEQRNAELERSLGENERICSELERILANLPCGVVVTDAAGAITRENSEAARLLNLAETCRRIEDLPEPLRSILGRLSQETGEQECCVVPGCERWLAVRHAPLLAASVFIVQDITEQKRWEKERERERRGVALGEMAAVLAHEIRNPLASLELFAGLLAEAQLPGEAGMWAAHLQAGLRGLETTVNSVLHFHHPETPERAAVDLGALVDQTLAFLQPLARQHGIQLAPEHQLHGLSVSANPHRLQQVLLNLAANALRFTPAGGKVRFGGRRVRAPLRNWAEMEVSDDGPGITSENRERIFEPGSPPVPAAWAWGWRFAARLFPSMRGPFAFPRMRGMAPPSVCACRCQRRNHETRSRRG
jgi:signal transduction histidine kinase